MDTLREIQNLFSSLKPILFFLSSSEHDNFLLSALDCLPSARALAEDRSPRLLRSSHGRNERIVFTSSQVQCCSVCCMKIIDVESDTCEVCGGEIGISGVRESALSETQHSLAKTLVTSANLLVLVGLPTCPILSSLVEVRHDACRLVLLGTASLAREAPPVDYVLEGDVRSATAALVASMGWTVASPPSHQILRVFPTAKVEECEVSEEKKVGDAIASALAAASTLTLPLGSDDSHFLE